MVTWISLLLTAALRAVRQEDEVQPTPMQKMSRTHVGIVSAIAIREIEGQQANLMYGYGWELFDIILSVGGLVLMKVIIKAFNPPGMPPMTFVLTGALPWFMFNAARGAVAGSIKKNKQLLLLPGVTPLDLIFGSAVRVFITYLIIFVFSTTVSSSIEGVGFPRFPMGIALLFISCWLIGILFGMIVLPLERIYAPANKFIGFPMRFGLFFSGVFLLITAFPTFVWPYLTWNPMLHAIELIHTYWFYTYKTPVGKPGYVLECIIGMAACGLLLERYSRRRFPV